MSDEENAKQLIDHLYNDLAAIRSGRASPDLINPLPIVAYGTQTRLKDLAHITAPEGRQLLIAPFDPKLINTIIKALEEANLGLNCTSEQTRIRVRVSPLDESLRNELIKHAKKRGENAKIALREIRRKRKDILKKEKEEKLLTEDEKKREEKRVQELIDKQVKRVDELLKGKIAEIAS